MNSWNCIRLGDVCCVNTEAYSEKERWDYVHYLDTGNITKNCIDEIQYIDLMKEKLPSRARRKVKYNSILYSTVRPNQCHYGIVKEQSSNFLVSTGFSVIDVIDERVDADFLYCYLTMNTVTEKMHAIAEQSTSAYPAIKSSDIEDLELKLPDILTQKCIASFLMSLEHKITNNTKLNKNLERQSQVIFKSWFVDFEPFGRIMPKSFTLTKLGKIATIQTSNMSPSKNKNVTVEHYSIPAYDESRFPIFEASSNIKSNKYLLSNKSVMISKLNPETKRIWRPMCLSEHPICSTEFIVYEAINKGYRDFLYSLVDSEPFFNYLCSHTTGSTNSRQRTSPRITLDFEFYLPPNDWIQKFCSMTAPLYDTISSNLIEI